MLPVRRGGDATSECTSRRAATALLETIASSFGLALGELVLAVGSEEDLEPALNSAYLAARAVLISSPNAKRRQPDR